MSGRGTEAALNAKTFVSRETQIRTSVRSAMSGPISRLRQLWIVEVTNPEGKTTQRPKIFQPGCLWLPTSVLGVLKYIGGAKMAGRVLHIC